MNHSGSAPSPTGSTSSDSMWSKRPLMPPPSPKVLKHNIKPLPHHNLDQNQVKILEQHHQHQDNIMHSHGQGYPMQYRSSPAGASHPSSIGRSSSVSSVSSQPMSPQGSFSVSPKDARRGSQQQAYSGRQGYGQGRPTGRSYSESDGHRQPLSPRSTSSGPHASSPSTARPPSAGHSPLSPPWQSSSRRSSASPQGRDSASRGLDLFKRQQEKLAQMGADRQGSHCTCNPLSADVYLCLPACNN